MSNVENALEKWTDPLWERVLPGQRDQPEVLAELRQTCDDNTIIVDRECILAPNTYTLELPPDSHRRLAPYKAQVQRQLDAQVCRHAAEQGYTFPGPVSVHIHAASDGAVEQFRLSSGVDPT
ncbi:DUF3662 domain-containing protein [Streptomyces sp. NBC_01283]|uniref:DUF3662 domain-containing protein n=1 Tax=Streptomyces sp. NBC_01283 TaxID=2903812 RepID=UPI00352C6930|nr:DUF3662 domain-containing protein [Streptomyces sp. NBC_01283]